MASLVAHFWYNSNSRQCVAVPSSLGLSILQATDHNIEPVEQVFLGKQRFAVQGSQVWPKASSPVDMVVMKL